MMMSTCIQIQNLSNAAQAAGYFLKVDLEYHLKQQRTNNRWAFLYSLFFNHIFVDSSLGVIFFLFLDFIYSCFSALCGVYECRFYVHRH